MVKKKPTAKKKTPASKKASLQVITVPTIPPDFSKWPTEAKTAQLLGVSVRTVRRMAAEGKLGRSKRKVIAGRRPLAVYNPDDIIRSKAEQQMGGSLQMKPAAQSGSSLALVETVVGATVKETVREFAQELLATMMGEMDKRLLAATQTSQELPKLYLTIGEGSKVTGLSKAYLRRKIQSGELPSVKDGRSTKLRRTDLELMGAASAELVNKAGR